VLAMLRPLQEPLQGQQQSSSVDVGILAAKGMERV
jgi:hypothetical protein